MTFYVANFNAVPVSVQQDLFELSGDPTSGAETIILALELSQSSEVGDAQEENLNILIKRGVGSVTGGSGGTTVTPKSVGREVNSFNGSCKVNNTTKMAIGTGTIDLLHPDNWNIRTSYLWFPPEHMYFILGSGDKLTVELATTPASAITMTGTLYFTAI
jgi:hypothetical protein